MLHDLTTAITMGKSHEELLKDHLRALEAATKKATELSAQEKEIAEAEK